jgi:acyl-CoA synthetase (AMP-forming)/AMP-acid ligase II
MSAERLDEGLRRWGQVFMQLYGQVEAPNTICTLRIADHVQGAMERLSSCGRPALAIDVTLLDDDGHSVADGQPGEICVRGPLVMDGYLDDPAATRESVRDGWLRTGDIAVRDGDGFLRIIDRRKDMIVSGGFNIYAGEVEQALNTHPSVRECAVIGVPDDTWGEAVTAYVVLTGDAAADTVGQTLIAHVRAARGPAWAPKHVHVVDALPLTRLGKPDKKQLRSAHWTVGQRAVH